MKEERKIRWQLKKEVKRQGPDCIIKKTFKEKST